MRFLILLVLACAASGPAVATSQPASEAPPERPSILWISAEDLNPRLGAYGDRLARTPHLDRLADDGITFANAFVTAAVCSPSRSAIITGMYQNSIGTHHHRTTTEAPGLPTPYQAVPPPYVKTFTEHLRAAGYYTTNNGKMDYQFGEPFTAWDESGSEAHWRHRPEGEAPFFSVFNVAATHESRIWPGNDEDDQLETDPSAVEVPPYNSDTPVVRRSLARNYDNIAQMDRQVGRLLDQLAEDGLMDDTIVFFWGDHGEGLPRAKRWLYDSGIHVPLIVHVPEKYRAWAGAGASGSVSDRLVSLVDLGPTVLSLAGVPIPAPVQGRAFFGPQAAAPRQYVFAARDRIDISYDMVRAARDERFKYVRNFFPEKPYAVWIPYRNRSPVMQELLQLHAEDKLEGPAKLWMRPSRPPEELYDTEADPHEIHNLASDPRYRDVLERMQQSMNAWMGRIGDLGRVSEAQMARRMWPGMKQPATHAPLIIPRRSTGKQGAGSERTNGSFEGPMEVAIYCPTQGASVAYKIGEAGRWKLYSGPVRLTEGTTTIHAKAIRYGYTPSAEAQATFTVSEGEQSQSSSG